MENSYQKSRFGKIVLWIIVSILLITAVGAIVVFNRKDNKPVEENATTYQSGMVMMAVPTVRLNEPTGVRFTAQITPELYNEVMADENKVFGMVIAPISYFMKVDVDEVPGDCDWLKEFEKETVTVLTMDDISPYAYTESDGTLVEYRMNGAITSILYKNTNLQFLGIGYVKTTDGENITYKYASHPDGLTYKQCAYSFAYVAAERLNSYVVRNEHLAQADLDMLNGVINNSVDLANGLTEATDDGSAYAVTLSDIAKTLKVDEEFTIKVDIAEAVKTSIWWQSTDTNVAVVENGVVKAVGEGTATINVYVAGEKYTCAITVGEVTETPEANV